MLPRDYNHGLVMKVEMLEAGHALDNRKILFYNIGSCIMLLFCKVDINQTNCGKKYYNDCCIYNELTVIVNITICILQMQPAV